MKLNNKVVWITGASSGIGEAIAYAFAQQGCRLVLSGRNTATLAIVKNNCTKAAAVTIVPFDLAEHDTLATAAKQAVEQFGRVDILVNNAGISQRSLIVETDFEVDKQLVNTNLLGTIGLTKALLPSMIAQQSGHIIVVSSLMGKFSAPLRSTYAAAKHGLHGFFDALRLELEQDQINVLMVCPGYVVTNISKNALTGDGSKQETMDEATANGIEAKQVAQELLTALAKNKEEIYVGKKEVIGVYLKRYFPKLLNRVIKRSKVT